MDRSEVTELCCIQSIANLNSIAMLGILSRNSASQVDHTDISMADVQDLRAPKRVPDARVPKAQWRPLHDYANLYFCPRNPMLYKRLALHRELAVLRLRADVLDMPDAVITDGNAASGVTRFGTVAEGLARIDKDVTYAKYWIHDDPYRHAEHKRRMCAELLIPDCVPAEFIFGAYVSGDDGARACTAAELPWPSVINRYVFFT